MMGYMPNTDIPNHPPVPPSNLKALQDQKKCSEETAPNIVLNHETQQDSFGGIVTAPGHDYLDYKITCIDVTGFPNGGKLIFNITVGDGESSASFDLFPGSATIPDRGRPHESLAGVYDVGRSQSREMIHYFDKGSFFQFGATGNWFSRVGSTNQYRVVARVNELD